MEQRRLVTSTLLNDYLDWPGVRQVCQITRTVQKQENKTTEVAYAICSVPRAQADAAQILKWWRGHWGIENRVHWVRDATLQEDASKIRSGTAPQILAAVRNAAISFLRSQKVTNIAEALREHAVKVTTLFSRLGRWNN